jgi:hypothetical protein
MDIGLWFDIKNGFTFAMSNLSRKIQNSKKALSLSFYFSFSHWKNKHIFIMTD